MRLHEYQSKDIFRKYQIPIPQGRLASTPDEARRIAEDLNGPVVLKAQVLTGGRGKAGGVRLVKSPGEADEEATKILGKRIKGFPVRRILIEEAVSFKQEIYIGMTVEREQGNILLIASAEGGVDIEEIARTSPEKIAFINIDPLLGLKNFQSRNLAAEIEIPRPLWRSFIGILNNLQQVFLDHDGTLVEINPLVISNDNRLIALDGKIVVDDSALYRHPELVDKRDITIETPEEIEARKFSLSYIKLSGNIGCLVNGAGLAMATMDIIQHQGGHPANFLDIGGGASAEKVAAALRIILSDPQVETVLINIFGGITRCDEVAIGIQQTLQENPTDVPFVIRLVGTNEIEGRNILASADLDTASTLKEAAVKAVSKSKVEKT